MAKKYKILAQALREELTLHRSIRNYRLPPERELSERYQVSRQTVRRALLELTQEGLIARFQGSGAYATGQQARKAMEIAVITPSAEDYIYPALLHDMEEVLQQHGYRCKTYVHGGSIAAEQQILEQLLSDPPGGILAEGCKTALQSPNLGLYRQLSNTPTVFFRNVHRDLPQIPSVTDDNRTGVRMLAQHLLSRGHRRIGCILRSDEAAGQERYLGAAEALLEAGLPAEEQWFCWLDGVENTRLVGRHDTALLADLLETRLKDVTAVICHSDEIAFALISLLQKQGKSVPEDCAVVSFDNSYLCHISPITSLGHSARMGTLAAQKLLQLLQGQSCTSASLPWELKQRKSG